MGTLLNRGLTRNRYRALVADAGTCPAPEVTALGRVAPNRRDHATVVHTGDRPGRWDMHPVTGELVEHTAETAPVLPATTAVAGG